MANHDSIAPDKTATIFQSPTFEEDIRIRVDLPIGSATISPSGRDVALASKHGLYIIDLDSPYSPPRHIRHETPWTPADVQWSPFHSRPYWVVDTSNQRALVWNLELATRKAPIEFVLHAHYRAITDINFSPFHPDILSTCAVDGFVHNWDLRIPSRPATSFSDWFAGATQVKWNRKDPHIVASSHDRFLRIWDDRKGAIPLTTIEAHATKIYGVDWSRFDANKVITCSLDRTIKIWDYSVSDVHPERVIRTPYPVWRARHTPFGQGILAMPQRGDDRLHLFDGRYDSATPWDSHVEPVYSFKGHGDSVKEFLWRARGTISDDMRDNRDFQLVSWGADHELILHRMRDKYLAQAGYEKGMQIKRSLQLTRRGSPYISYRDVSVQKEMTGSISHLRNGHATREATMRPPITTVDSQSKSGATAITWMKGVKFGKGSRASRRNAKRSFQALSNFSHPPDKRETLSDEIIHASDTFKKLVFDDIDVKARHLLISLTGPWGLEDKSIFVKLGVSFPRGYPASAPPNFDLSKSSALSDERMDRLENDLDKIAAAHLKQRTGCLESVLYYLTGEHDLRQTVAWLDAEFDGGQHDNKLDSSSDEEDPLGDFATTESQLLISGDGHGAGPLSGNANVPLPKACGGIWAPNGLLICFFPPKAQPVSLLPAVPITRGNSDVMLEGLGRLHADSAKPKVQGSPEDSEEESDLDDSSSTSSSSDSSDGIGFPIFSTGLYRRKVWARSSLKDKLRSGSVEGSQRTSAGPKSLGAPKPKTIISIQSHDDLLPTKLPLATQYEVFGSSVDVCRHNSQIANLHGQNIIADVWSLLMYILDNEVPLMSLMLEGQGSTFVMAKRALVRIQRQDSTLDLSFDEPDAVSHPHALGQIKWGKHPFSSDWLIQAIFDFFEREADVQMLAMLSCVLADNPTGTNSPHNASAAPIWPGEMIDYFPNDEVALFTANPRITLSSSHASSFDTNPQTQTFGSQPSSHGFPDSPPKRTSSDLATPLSNASTPPTLSRQPSARPSLTVSLSVSPETKPAPISGNPTFASSIWSRPFQLSSSPPTRHQRNHASGDENLASSLASSGGITWGPITVHGSNSTMRRAFLRDDDGSSTDDDDEVATPEESTVKVVLKNAMRFEDEGAGTKALIPEELRGRCEAWREVYASRLDSWGLVVRAAEVRKFNAGAGHGEDEGKGKIFDDGMSQITLVVDGQRGDVGEAGLALGRCCIRCGLVLDGRGREGKCPQCDARKRVLGCGVCLEPIRGLHKACFNCGHAAHSECFLALGYLNGDGEEVGLCESGCGCQCAAFGAVQLEEST
ncbi:hypothetical protein CAC42_6569 [Sphaceloma murrayae]|uniref:RWD domain-containing protein n=1 Tax=Sphaceloma murrayae TaxID=2082308 RepID=A0A2K1QFU6_9PEZI|nr:hypothetical protein CAC42_6569 [Sphaceloma murrayae]